MKKINIILVEKFSSSDIEELNDFSNENIKINAELIERYPASGGIGWEGITVFIAQSVFSAIIEALGKDIYIKFKNKLFKKKLKLDTEKESFKVQVSTENNHMLVFDMTNLNQEDFYNSFDGIIKVINQKRGSKSKGIFAYYNIDRKKWEFGENTILKFK